MSPQTFDLFVTLMIFFFSCVAFFFFLACAPASSRDPKINRRYLRPPNFDTKHSIEITKDFSHLRTSFFVSAIYFLLSYYQISSKEGERGKVFFSMLDKKLGPKIDGSFLFT